MNDSCWPSRIVTLGVQYSRKSETLSSPPDNHRRLSCRRDCSDPDADAILRNLVEIPESWKGLKIVTACLFRELDDSGSAVARAAGRIECHVSVASARSEDEEIDAAGIRDPAVKRFRIQRIRKPYRLVADTIRWREAFIDRSCDFFSHEVVTRPGPRVRRVFKLMFSLYQILIHHHQHEMSEILARRCKSS